MRCITETRESGVSFFRGSTIKAAVLATMFALGQLGAHAVVYVSPGGAGGMDGTSWANALGSMQAAVNSAAAVHPEGDEIWVAGGTYTEGATVVWATNVRAYGGFHTGDTQFSQRDLAPANASVISGAGLYRVISLSSLTNVCLDGFTVSGGSSSSPGAGIYGLSLDANVRIANCTITGNTTTGAVDGGGLCLELCTGVQVLRCAFTANNSATSDSIALNGGGGAVLLDSVATIDGCSFTSNTSYGHGGGLLAGGAGTTASTVIHNCTFTTNKAGTIAPNNRWGGGLCVTAGAAPLVTECVFTGNTATYTGGAIGIVFNAKPDIRDTRFVGNSSGGYGGGAVYIQEGAGETVTANFARCLFDGNTSTQYGGAGCLFGNNGMATTFSSCTFTNNQSPYGGGLFLLGSNDNVTITGCTFQGNTSTGGVASHGGAIYEQQSGTKLNLSRSYFIGNTANVYGGAIFTETQSSAAITNCVFYQNTSNSTLGGAILFNGLGLASTNTVMNCSFNGNKVLSNSGFGGAIRNWTGTAGSPTKITNSVFWGDTVGTPAVANEIDSSGGSATVTYCDVQGGYAGTGNITPAATPYVTAGAGLLRISGVVAATLPTNKGTNTGAPALDIIGTSRPQPVAGAVDMGAYEFENPPTSPSVTSITRLDPPTSPTNAATVAFAVAFSESVAKVAAANFTLNTTGVTGASILNVAGFGAAYTVTVGTGTGNGTIRCDYAPVSGSPANANNAVPAAYAAGEIYTIDKTSAQAPVIDSPNGGNDFTTSDPALTLSGTCSADTVTITVNGMTTGVSHAAGSTTWSYTTTLVAPFANLFGVKARNHAGNESAADTITVTYDRPPTDITLSADTVLENAPANTVVGTLDSVDPDTGDTFAYSVLSTLSDFNVNQNGLVWELRTSRPFDFETEPSLDVTVQTQDMGGTGLTFFRTFTITVADLDEIPPQAAAVNVTGARTVDVTFNEAMGAAVTAASSYLLSGPGKGSLTANPDSVALVAGDTYRLTWSTGEMFDGGDITVTISSAQDLAGNVIGMPDSGTDLGAGIGTPPVITLLGPNPVLLQCGAAYSDAGATASDNVDGNITANIATVNPVNQAVPNVYTVTYNVSDAAGNAAAQVARTVTVEADTTKPVITRLGAATETVECGAAYADAGATADDNCAGDITANINTANSVNTGVPGLYTVTYNVSDGNGNSAVEVTRSVTVQDTVIPAITLLGAASVTLECGTNYMDAGATAFDSCAGSRTANIVTVNPVNTSVPGLYTVTYNVDDGNGNSAVEVIRSVTVQDTGVPVISLNGPASETVECGAGYVDAGATATDACAGSLTADIVTANPVNAGLPGLYTVAYNVSDGNGNSAVEVTRTVTVQDTTGPVIAVQAPAVEYVPQWSAYTPPAYSAIDACGGTDYTGDVLAIGSVDTSTVDTYFLHYSVSDGLNNMSAATHTVVVEAVSTLALTAVAETVTAIRGSQTVLEVQATGNVGPVVYQWYKKTETKSLAPIDGATDVQLILQPVEYSDAGVYVSEGTDHQLSAMSPEITLVVDPGVPVASLAGLAALAAALGLGGAVRARKGR